MSFHLSQTSTTTLIYPSSEFSSYIPKLDSMSNSKLLVGFISLPIIDQILIKPVELADPRSPE